MPSFLNTPKNPGCLGLLDPLDLPCESFAQLSAPSKSKQRSEGYRFQGQGQVASGFQTYSDLFKPEVFVKVIVTLLMTSFNFGSRRQKTWRETLDRSLGLFFTSAFRPVWPGHCIVLGLICVPRHDPALDQGGAEPRPTVGVFFFARAPFGPGGLVAECIEPYLYSAVDSRPGPGGSNHGKLSARGPEAKNDTALLQRRLHGQLSASGPNAIHSTAAPQGRLDHSLGLRKTA